VIAKDKKGKTFETITGDDGVYRLKLSFAKYGSKKAFITATYEIIADRPNTGFKKTVLNDFKIVPSYKGIMNLDLVLEALDPEPCGYGGADCLKTDVIEINGQPSPSNKISPRPKIEEIKKENRPKIIE
jgi:hypothetical protein